MQHNCRTSMFRNLLCIKFYAQSITLSSSQPLSISPLILPIASADRFVPICFILLSMLFRTSFTIESDSVVSSTSWSVVGCIVMTGLFTSLSLILISPGPGCFRPDLAFPLAFVLTSLCLLLQKLWSYRSSEEPFSQPEHANMQHGELSINIFQQKIFLLCTPFQSGPKQQNIQTLEQRQFFQSSGFLSLLPCSINLM